eukprot:scaffold16488_cov42-Prasinocladus_malaysianus.AAC.1
MDVENLQEAIEVAGEELQKAMSAVSDEAPEQEVGGEDYEYEYDVLYDYTDEDFKTLQYLAEAKAAADLEAMQVQHRPLFDELDDEDYFDYGENEEEEDVHYLDLNLGDWYGEEDVQYSYYDEYDMDDHGAELMATSGDRRTAMETFTWPMRR